MKRVLQFERTDRDITDAFLRILSKKTFDKITIQDITAEAMISRSTFYQHFPDKYAILEKLNQQYITELTNLVSNVLLQDRTELKQIDQIMETYFIKNRRILRLLLGIKTEHMNITLHFRRLFTEYFQKCSDNLSELESYMMSGVFLDFFVYYLEHDMEADNYTTLLFESFYKMSLYFFQLEKNKEAQKDFLTLLDTHSKKQIR